MKTDLSNNFKNWFYCLFLTIPFTYSLHASEICEGEVCDCCNPSSVEFRAELLYFKATLDQPYFVIDSVKNTVRDEKYPTGKRINNEGSFHPGFRLEGLYHLCNCESSFDLRYTQFRNSHSKSVTGNFLFDTVGFPGDGAQVPEDTFYAGTATMRTRFRPYSVDLTYNRISPCFCPDHLTFLFGLHYAYISKQDHGTSNGSFEDENDLEPVTKFVANNLTKKSRFWGIGPQFGIDYAYTFPQCHCFQGLITIIANARASLLCSHTDASIHFSTDFFQGGPEPLPVVIDIENEPLWRVNPAFDTRLALSYEFCGCRFQGTIELGYEWIWYCNPIDSILGYDVAYAGASFDLYNNLNLHGPFLGLSLEF